MTRPTPRPFLKWVGGKGQLLPELLARIDSAGPIRRYHEPFIGGGALFFELARLGRLPRTVSFLSDSNERLIETYLVVRDHVEHLIELLEQHKAAHSKDFYYQMRQEVPEQPTERAARIIYLNKTCFNGLYRENSRGIFNVPMGSYANPAICDAANLREASLALQRAKLRNSSFRNTLNQAKPGDLVYLDPPYDPLSETSSFTSYEQSNFGKEDQRELAAFCGALHARGVKFLLSNSHTPFILSLYQQPGLRVEKVQATRSVNSRADRRGKISEVLVRNFGPGCE